MDDIKIELSKTIQLDLHVRAAIRDEDDIDALLDKIRERIYDSFDEKDSADEEKSKFLMENGTLYKLGLNGYYLEATEDEDYEDFENWLGGDDEE